MDEGREFRGTRNPFDIFGGFGTFGGSTPSIFGTNPFDDPFFTLPFGSVSTQASPLTEPRSGPASKGPVIHELNSDDETGGEQENEGDKEPFIEHPDEEPIIGKNEIAHKLHTCKVTYGGIDGAYYTSSSTRRMGDDGVLMEECREADKRTGEAKHRISRGIHGKGHSVTRKLKADGEVETLQTLHNLNEDELDTFESSWRGNAGRHITSSRGNSSTAYTGADWVGLLPSSRRAWEAEFEDEAASSSSRQQPKKVVRINIE